MPRQTFFPNPDNKPQGFSPATRAGNLVFVSGQVSTDAGGGLVGRGDCGAQAEQCLDNVEAALKAAGAAMGDVTKITAFLVDVDDYQAYAQARLRRFPRTARQQHRRREGAGLVRLPGRDRGRRGTGGTLRSSPLRQGRSAA